MFNKMKLYLFISIAFLFITCDTLASSKPEKISIKLSNIIELYKNGRYIDIIEISYNFSFKTMDEMLILAKSYENLGYYNRAYRKYREIYNRYPYYKGYIYYFIANLFNKMENFSEALKWYKYSLKELINIKERADKDWNYFLRKELNDVYKIYESGDEYNSDVKIILKSIRGLFLPSNYYLSRIYFEEKSYKKSKFYAMIIINSNVSKYYKIDLLKRLINSDKMIEMFLNDKSISFIEILEYYNMYYEILKVYNFIRNRQGREDLFEKETAWIYYKIGDYKNALIKYNTLYHKTKEPELLIKIAYSYYYLKRKKTAKIYLNRYLALQRYRFKFSYEAFYLKILYEIRSRNYNKTVEDMKYVIKKYGSLNDIDEFIYKVFYLLVADDQLENAIKLLFLYHPYIKDDYYNSWASYILGLYLDKRYFYDSILSFPGGFYYFRSIKYIKVPQKRLGIADRYYNKGDFDNALRYYILLYAAGYNKDYIKAKIENILLKKAPYKYLLALDKLTYQNSFIFRLYKLGLFEDIKDIFFTVSEISKSSEKYFIYYLLARIYYDENDYKRGLLYTEIILNSINYKIFFPYNLLTMLYPLMYEKKIKEELVKYNWFIDKCFVMSIIREESRYDKKALSNQGAVGLMQLMPNTASWLYSTRISRKKLLDPEFNIEIGIKYLNYLHRKFHDCCLILASYNGGPTNVFKWMKKYGNDNIDKFIEAIPYPETRNFVKKVFTTYSLYKETYSERCNEKQ